MKQFERKIFGLILVCASYCLQVQASSDVHGVDDWKASHVQDFFQANGVKVRIEDLESLGLDGRALLTYGDEFLAAIFEKLNLSHAHITKISMKIAEKRISILKAPADLFEWRIAHLRLFDYWITPLLYSPRAALLWIRFVDSNQLIEKVNDEVDEIPLFQFWSKWIVCPSYPIFQIARKFDSHTYVDDMLEFSFLLQSVGEAASFILLSIKLANGEGKSFMSEMLDFTRMALIAPASYYILYWCIPNFINHVYFYLTIYYLLPAKSLMALYLFFAQLQLLCAAGKKLKPA